MKILKGLIDGSYLKETELTPIEKVHHTMIAAYLLLGSCFLVSALVYLVIKNLAFNPTNTDGYILVIAFSAFTGMGIAVVSWLLFYFRIVEELSKE